MRVLMKKEQDPHSPPLFHTGSVSVFASSAWTTDLTKAWRVPEQSVDTLVAVSCKDDCIWVVVDLMERILTDESFRQWWEEACAVRSE